MSKDRSYYDKPNGDRRESYSVAANQFQKFYLIESKVKYSGAIVDPEGVRHVLPPDATAEQLGVAILDALGHSRFIPPSHPDFSKYFEKRSLVRAGDEYDVELMRLAGVRSKIGVYRGSKGVNVTLEVDHGEINIYASSRRTGSSFWSNKDDVVGQETVPATASAVDLGEAYLRALAKGGSVS